MFNRKYLKNNFLFQARWLENERFKHWIRKKDDTVAICNYCSKDVSVTNMEDTLLMSHIKAEKTRRKVSF